VRRSGRIGTSPGIVRASIRSFFLHPADSILRRPCPSEQPFFRASAAPTPHSSGPQSHHPARRRWPRCDLAVGAIAPGCRSGV